MKPDSSNDQELPSDIHPEDPHRGGQLPVVPTSLSPDLQSDCEAYWNSFLSSLPGDSPYRKQRYLAESFGDSPELADQLATLIRSGVKTATCSSLWEWQAEGSQLPTAGALTLVLDGSSRPICMIETVQVEIVPFEEVGADFAAAEGEGDGTLAYWREAHWRYFARVLENIDRQPELQMPLVCERFRLIY